MDKWCGFLKSLESTTGQFMASKFLTKWKEIYNEMCCSKIEYPKNQSIIAPEVKTNIVYPENLST